MSNYIYNPDSGELYHYGVKGMKWGHRKRPEYVESARANMKSARANKRAANKAYNKAYRRAENYSSNHAISQFTSKKRGAEADRRWGEAYERGKEANKADAAYKTAKKEYQQANKQAKSEHKQAKKADLADRKSREKERKALVDEYGKLEDQYTYGKHANKAKNAQIDKRLGEIDDRLDRLAEADANMILNGRHEGERIMGRVGHKTMGVVSTMATVHLGASAINSFSKGDFMSGAIYGAGAALALGNSEGHRKADQRLKRY